jgi:hypothetical protein
MRFNRYGVVFLVFVLFVGCGGKDGSGAGHDPWGITAHGSEQKAGGKWSGSYDYVDNGRRGTYSFWIELDNGKVIRVGGKYGSMSSPTGQIGSYSLSGTGSFQARFNYGAPGAPTNFVTDEIVGTMTGNSFEGTWKDVSKAATFGGNYDWPCRMTR